MKRSSLFFAAALLMLSLAAIAFAPAPAEAGKVIKLHNLNKDDPFDNPTGAMVTVFKSLVEAGTNGDIQVQTFPNGQLGKDNEVVAQVKAGVIQSGIHSVGGFASIYPMMGVIDVPFAFPNISATYAVFDGPFGAKLAADIEKKTGLKVLGFGDSGGFFHFTNSKRPIKSPEDMKGLKIRTMGLDTHKAIVSALGGQPSVIPWAEVYTALQTGVADGQMNPVPIISFAKMNEVQKYLTLSGHLFAPYVWVMNKAFYDGLTPQEKARPERRRQVGHRRRPRGRPRDRGLGQGHGGAQQGNAGQRPHAGPARQVPRPHHAGGKEDHRRKIRPRRRGHDEGLPGGHRRGIEVTLP